jgi:hypothetical protein
MITLIVPHLFGVEKPATGGAVEGVIVEAFLFRKLSLNWQNDRAPLP